MQRIAIHDRDVNQGRIPFSTRQATTETPDSKDAAGGFTIERDSTLRLESEKTDRFLSGDSQKNEQATDTSYQQATIDNGGTDIGNGGGGKIYFNFDAPVRMFDLKVIDTEEGGFVDAFDADGNLLKSVKIPQIADGAISQVIIDQEGVSTLKVRLNSSGAIDDICYVPASPAPGSDSGSISGRVFCDLDCDGLDGMQDTVVFQPVDCSTYGKATDLTFRYIDSSNVSNTQEGKAKILTDGRADDDGVSYVVVSDKENPFANFYFAGEVAVGADFTASADKFGSSTFIHFFDDNPFDGAGTDDLLQSSAYHTSCSKPINIGDATLVQYTGQDGTIGSTPVIVVEPAKEGNGNYDFTGLEPGQYQMQFVLPNGFSFTTQSSVDADAVNGDSDAGAAGLTGCIELSSGETENDVDAGLTTLNGDPAPTDDEGKTCYDEAVSIDVLDNDIDPENDILTIMAVNGFAISEYANPGDELTINGVEVRLVNGELVFDGSVVHANLTKGIEATDTFTYTVSDGNGGTGTADVAVTFCGANDTVDKINTLLPDSVQYQLVDEALDNRNDLVDDYSFEKARDAFTMNVTDASGLLAGVFESAYCVSFFDTAFASPQANVPLFDAQASLATAANVSADLATQVGIKGLSAADNIDLVNWILNQDLAARTTAPWMVAEILVLNILTRKSRTQFGH